MEKDVKEILKELSRNVIWHPFYGVRNTTKSLIVDKKEINCSIENSNFYSEKRSDINMLISAICIKGSKEFLEKISHFNLSFNKDLKWSLTGEPWNMNFIRIDNPYRLLNKDLSSFLYGNCSEQIFNFSKTIDTSESIFIPLLGYSHENLPDSSRCVDIDFEIKFKNEFTVETNFIVEIIGLDYEISND